MENKAFQEVFPDLSSSEEFRQLWNQVEITKISMNRAKNHLRIYLLADHLIFYDRIRAAERTIRERIFPNQEMSVELIEKYHLSGQYTARKLMDVYKESILEELSDRSLLEFNLLQAARMEFTDEEHMLLTLEDSVIAKAREEELVLFLKRIFCDRCGLSFSVTVDYAPPEENPYKLNHEFLISEKIRAISMRASFAQNTAQGSGEADGGALIGAGDDKMNQKSHNASKSDGKAARLSSRKKGEFRRKVNNYTKNPLNPDVLYGKDFEQELLPLDQLTEPIGDVAVHGKIIHTDVISLKNDKSIYMLTITDFRDSIKVKIFTPDERLAELKAAIREKMFIKVKGMTGIDTYGKDNELIISSVTGIKKEVDFVVPRTDHSLKKRVELHCHTKMSDMDGVSDVADIIKCAMKWGHQAIAITDHGNVQAFPDANHAAEEQEDFKVIYGVEAYLVDDLKQIVTDSKNQTLDGSYVVFDIETTGFSPEKNKIIEIGAVKVCGGEITERFSAFINPQVPIPYHIVKLTSIRDDMVMDAPPVEEVLPRFLEFCGGSVLVAHNAGFDMSFIRKNCERLGLSAAFTVLDTETLARVLLWDLKKYKLDTVAKKLNIALESHHRAVDDAECTAHIFIRFIAMLKERGLLTLDEVNGLGLSSVDTIRKMHSYHAIILATCDQGRNNLYHLISLSHLKYFGNNKPRIPKSEFLKYRDGLLIGSACEAGELYQALLKDRPKEEIAALVDFYDYLEIQPVGNNAFMLKSEEYAVDTVEDLQELNRQIVKLGEEFGKPVVATCDVHFLNPEDEIYRRIIMTGQGFKDADEQAPLYLHTTEEMLKEFEYLGSRKAEEVVITNPNKIADMCERISPVRPDKCPPVIENSDGMLRDICYSRAHKMYGDPLPKEVSERLERELNSIISNGYAVMYIIAQKLVWKSNEDGYLVGSRGSVGSSFVATMSGITEVNPLHAHYLCENCKYSDFDSELVRSFAGRSGCDMPDQNCPVCGKPLSKLGFDIPFETFLGFEGNKEPDIDLNFSGEYQSKAHKYTEVIFGEGQTYKAGTIGTLADKTAYGYVKKYFEEHELTKRKSEIERITEGCVGIRRTTGQHPGGIVVLPMGEDIDTFTPVQHPANDMTTDIVTTHFDYHSIDHNLLKLDILGHDDPTMIRMLQDLTGIDPTTIPFDDKTVMSLFQNTSALGITPDDIGGCTLGALGIPEFGTDFAMGMLIDTKPQEFSDLIRIAGLSHGTDVWLGNAKELILSGQATISTAICTRDDIMTYLIGMGLESEKSFKIMEAVRKGAVARGKCDKWEEWKADMLAHDVPEWYVKSCEKIQYMFPKAHAAAYVMMAWRIAYCKVFYPLAYYAAFFSIRATGFSYELMCMGKERLEFYIQEYLDKKNSPEKSKLLTKKEEDAYRDMRIVQEMYARGFSFLPIDLYTAQPHNFQIIDGKLMPSFNSIDGLGDNAAISIAEAAKDGPFLSKDDFRERTGVPKNVVGLLADLGILGDIPDSNQLSLFDL